MAIQWYPGHMTKARRVIVEAMPAQDVVIEVLDARFPHASENPVVTEARRHRPCLKVLAKSDLADPAVTDAWIEAFEGEVRPSPGDGLPPGKVLAFAHTMSRPAEATRRITDLCKELAPNRGGRGKPVRAMIVGVPNVGKSTLVNTLMGRKVAKTGDVPAVTKSVQVCVLPSGIVLTDNPGITWPKFEDDDAAYRLAFGGSIPDSAIDYEDVAFWGATFLLAHYPDALVARYRLAALPPSADAVLDEIGRRRGALRSGGVVDRQKASSALLHDFRSGALGRISLESPRR